MSDTGSFGHTGGFTELIQFGDDGLVLVIDSTVKRLIFFLHDGENLARKGILYDSTHMMSGQTSIFCLKCNI
jgi:hypothetical protein